MDIQFGQIVKNDTQKCKKNACIVTFRIASLLFLDTFDLPSIF